MGLSLSVAELRGADDEGAGPLDLPGPPHLAERRAARGVVKPPADSPHNNLGWTGIP